MSQNYNRSLNAKNNVHSDSDCELYEEDVNSNGQMSDINYFNNNSQYQNNKRNSRNQNEKHRRDEFNSLIQELETFIDSKRKIDKISVLSETINYFHNNDSKLKEKEISHRFKPFFLDNHEFIASIFDLQNAFCLVFDLNGMIKYVSNEITDLLDLEQETVQGECILGLVDEKSAKKIRSILKKKHISEEIIDFDCRFKTRNTLKPLTETFNINGCFKLTPNSSIESIGHFNTIARMSPALRVAKYCVSESKISEFQSQIYFSLDLKFIRVDTEITKLIGYGQMELLGTSLYEYCYIHDLDKLADFHRELTVVGDKFSLLYRMVSKGEQIIIVDAAFILIEPNTIICKLQLPKKGSKLLNTAQNSNADIMKYDMKRRISNNENTQESINQLNGDNQNCSHSSYDKIVSQNTPGIQTTQSERQIDDSLATIFLRSYNDVSYRHYVLNLLRSKRNSVHNSITKQQEELRILDETIDNINDPKKLGSWLNEFQYNKIKNNLLTNSQQ